MKKNHYTSRGLALGVAFGAALGAAYDNLGLWISLGLVFGLAIGGNMDRKKNRADPDDQL